MERKKRKIRKIRRELRKREVGFTVHLPSPLSLSSLSLSSLSLSLLSLSLLSTVAAARHSSVNVPESQSARSDPHTAAWVDIWGGRGGAVGWALHMKGKDKVFKRFCVSREKIREICWEISGKY